MGANQSNEYTTLATSVSDFELGWHCYKEQDTDAAIKYFEAAAQKGNKLAQWHMHYVNYDRAIYSTGHIELITEEVKELLSHYNDLPEDIVIQTMIGRVYHYVLKQNKEAFIWWSKAEGYAPAQNALGKLYYRGQEVALNYEIAHNYFELATQQGYGPAQVNLGFMYEEGQYVKQDYVMAYKCYLPAAQKSHRVAQYKLAGLYRGGKEIKYDRQTVLKYYELSANNGYKPAQQYLVMLYERTNPKESFRWLTLLAEGGDEEYQYDLGCIYNNEKGDRYDAEAAVKWWTLAAKGEYLPAQVELGKYYDKCKNYKEAWNWYLLAAQQGNAWNQYIIGCRYRSGLGIKHNKQEAIRWLTLSANQNSGPAQNELALMYESGNGVKRNCQTASASTSIL